MGINSDAVVAVDTAPAAPALLQFGEMHEAIGLKQHEGRVRLSELVSRPHFYAVGALEGLRGEVTILDGVVTVTTVGADGHLQASDEGASEQQATMLVGAYVSAWTDREATEDVAADDLDQFIHGKASSAGLDVDQPFLFTITGQFTDVQLHVINGACPVHARMKKLELPPILKPFEADMPMVQGTVVGVYAQDAVGKLTHPATSTHLHLLYQDPESGQQVAGHAERMGLQRGAVLHFPQP